MVEKQKSGRKFLPLLIFALLGFGLLYFALSYTTTCTQTVVTCTGIDAINPLCWAERGTQQNTFQQCVNNLNNIKMLMIISALAIIIIAIQKY